MARHKPGDIYLLKYQHKQSKATGYVTVEYLGAHQGNALRNGCEVMAKIYGRDWIAVVSLKDLIPRVV